ncbi:glycosyltransferase family 4 protein [Candidatus Sumerlaeota bacterium]|nr:glycosyltransferase family 4 protein [Candidatus Sumerlaeota bacterium]
MALLNSARRWIGEAAHVLMLAEGLRGRGVEVTLFARRGHELERRAREAGLDVEALEFASRFSWLTERRDIRRLREIIRERRIQVLHAHRGKDHWIAALARRGVKPRPALLRTRHVVTPMRNHVFNRWLMRRATDSILAVSDAARQSMAAVLKPEQLGRVCVIPSAVDLTAFHPNRRSETVRCDLLGLGELEVAVGLVARMQRVKGQRVLLEAAAKLVGSGHRARFVLAGAERSPGRIDALERLAEDLGVGERVVFLREIEDIAALIASLDIGVVASLGSEGSSRVAHECMASGVPLVATRVGVLPELIRDGENGLLCEPGDADALADRIGRLIDDSDLRARLAKEGRAHVEAHHSPEGWLDAIQAVYAEAVSRVG